MDSTSWNSANVGSNTRGWGFLIGILFIIHGRLRIGYVLFVMLVTVDFGYTIMISKCYIVCVFYALEVNESTDMKCDSVALSLQ
jgi:hypothetical protein